MTLVRIHNANVEALILLENGGRIVSFNKIGGHNLLESNPSMWNEKEEERLVPSPDMLEFRGYNGHEVWVGPQSQWWKQQSLNPEKANSDLFWPPDPYISFGIYHIIEQSESHIVIQGDCSPISGVSFQKNIRIDKDGNLLFDVTATNHRKSDVSWDLWLITRVNGYCPNFVPIDQPKDFHLGEPSHPWQGRPSYQIKNGYFSFTPQNFDRTFDECTGKAYLNTNTPIIYTRCGDEWLTLSFPHNDPATIHHEQAEIELYNFVCAEKKDSLLELEYHTPYRTLKPGESMSAHSKWQIGKPSNINELLEILDEEGEREKRLYAKDDVENKKTENDKKETNNRINTEIETEIETDDEVQTDQIQVFGARVHNLKNIDVSMPRDKLVVVTGLSGSGKSSLAFDTIYAEGQRRYIDTFSAYARNFLGNMERPDVDKITGLSPVISIEQKTTNKNPRSTVGTTTEVYDFLRLLFARAGEAYSYVTGEKMVKYTEDQIIQLIEEDFKGEAVYLLAPVINSRKGHYKELFEQIRRKGYLSVRVDGQLKEIVHGMKLDRYKNHTIEIVIDKLVISDTNQQRIKESVRIALQQGKGTIALVKKKDNSLRHFSRFLMCPTSGISYAEPAPHNFSFNSPHGSCPKCKGLGGVNIFDVEKIIPDKKVSIYNGGIVPLGKYKKTLFFWQLESIAERYDFSLKDPIEDIPEEALDVVLNGTDERVCVKNESLGASNMTCLFEGVVHYIQMQQETDASATAQKWAGQFSKQVECPVCHGARLNQEALHFRIAGKNIAELANMDITELIEWVDNAPKEMSEKQYSIAELILKEIKSRLQFMVDVGLDYLSLNRATATLSGGESQRIRLATQIGSQLVNVLYILDEPSIGLHQRDNVRLIDSLKKLRDIGNSVIVVEHDKDMMLASDYIVDIGPFAGRKGGEVVFSGTPEEMLKTHTMTADYLNGNRKIEIPTKLREGNGKSITIFGAKGNNLKNITVNFPLNKFICVTGVSGSGKSTLVNNTLQPILSQHFYHSLQDPFAYDDVSGLENVDKVICVDQTPIGRTPRSNPSTYTGLFGDIRELFVQLPESKMRGYRSGRFSFNVKGGRCEDCMGNGYRTIEMNFLPDVLMPCETCRGQRYNRETLEVKYKGKSIADVLDMTINMAVDFFENLPTIYHKLRTMQEIGLGYIKLGQPSTTLSGGESQRIKLATELMKRNTGSTIYILDEPTTGLHFEDIRILLETLNKLVDQGNTVIVIEHNLDVIKVADYIIDIGPEGGRNGGTVVATGTPYDIAGNERSHTGRFLKAELGME